MKQNSKKRPIALGAILTSIALCGFLWKGCLFHDSPEIRSDNSIQVIAPYKYAGTWVFDDPRVGLEREPFVAGIPEMIDEMVQGIPNAEEGFRLLFSSQEFPDHTHKLVWRRGDEKGNWYYCPQYDKEGWLCPGLFKYFDEAPPELYVKAEAK